MADNALYGVLIDVGALGHGDKRFAAVMCMMPWVNIETFVDGINFSGNNVYVCTNPDKYADDTDSGYTDVGTKTGSNGYIKALGFSKTAPWAFYPTAVGGSNTTYITDQCWNTSSGWKTMRSQGTGNEGILYMSIDKNSNNSGVSISTRLMFVPSKH